MKKHIHFQVSDQDQLSEKVIAFFTQSGFRYDAADDDQHRFFRSSSILDSWISNPLKWGSEIKVAINQNLISADFLVDTKGQMNTKEEESVWDTFVEDFKRILEGSADRKEATEKAIKDAKKSRLVYISWAVLGALVGSLFGYLISSWTGNKIIGYFAIPVMVTFFLTYIINYKKAIRPFSNV